MDKAFEKFFGPDEVTNKRDDTPITPEDKRVVGKITGAFREGYGFIESKEIPFERIFFHWTSLRQDTLRFPEVKKGMKAEFTPRHMGDMGWRAVKIKILE